MTFLSYNLRSFLPDVDGLRFSRFIATLHSYIFRSGQVFCKWHRSFGSPHATRAPIIVFFRFPGAEIEDGSE